MAALLYSGSTLSLQPENVGTTLYDARMYIIISDGGSMAAGIAGAYDRRQLS